MRTVLVALLVTSAALLAGCSDDGGHDDVFTCPDGPELNLDDYPEHHNATFNPLTKCAKSSASSSSSAPNVLPTLKLTVTDDNGTETVIGVLDGNLTFSAEGSTDSDGSITGIAVSVTDSNTTRTSTLYNGASKTFTPATFKFDRPGVVNVTVAMVDDRAGFTVNQSKVYVNHPQVNSNGQIQLPDPTLSFNDACGGATQFEGTPIGPSIVDSQYFKLVSFAVFPGATLIEATARAGSALLTVCDPAGTAISDEKAEGAIATAPGTALPPATGTTSYTIGVYSSEGQMDTTLDILVHYEPQTAAAAE